MIAFESNDIHYSKIVMIEKMLFITTFLDHTTIIEFTTHIFSGVKHNKKPRKGKTASAIFLESYTVSLIEF